MTCSEVRAHRLGGGLLRPAPRPSLLSWMDCFSYVYFYFMYISVCLHVCKYTTCVLGAKSEEGVKCSVTGVRDGWEP